MAEANNRKATESMTDRHAATSHGVVGSTSLLCGRRQTAAKRAKTRDRPMPFRRGRRCNNVVGRPQLELKEYFIKSPVNRVRFARYVAYAYAILPNRM